MGNEKTKHLTYNYLDQLDSGIKTIDDLNRRNALEKYKTALHKAQLINDINGEFGDLMLEDPRKIIITKRGLFYKFFRFLRKLFTKF